jgi:hypothetical protein
MAGIELDGVNQKVVLDSDGDTYLEAATDDTIKVYVAGAHDATISANAINVLSGTTLTIDSGATITNSGTANGFGSNEPSSADGQALGSASAEWSDLFLADGGIIKFGNDQDTLLTHTDGTGLTLNSTNKLCFNDASQFVQGSSATVLSIGATDEIDLTATAVDLNGTLDVSGTSLLTGRVGVITAGDLGSGIHVRKADSGGSVMSDNDALVLEGSAGIGMTLLGGHEDEQTIAFGDNGDSDIGFIKYHHNSNSMHLGTNAGERVRITSGGNVGIADTVPAAALEVSPTSSEGVIYATGNSQANELIRWNNTNSTSTNHTISFFKRNGTTTGSISQTNNATAFNTSSDYRIKENVNYNFDATARLKQLKPARFNFKTDVDKTVDGFIAHEVSDIIPEAITGTKDATETKEKVILNASGNLVKANVEEEDWLKAKKNGDYANDTTWEESKVFPIYQAIDQSRLVPLLVKTILELEARITALESE